MQTASVGQGSKQGRKAMAAQYSTVQYSRSHHEGPQCTGVLEPVATVDASHALVVQPGYAERQRLHSDKKRTQTRHNERVERKQRNKSMTSTINQNTHAPTYNTSTSKTYCRTLGGFLLYT